MIAEGFCCWRFSLSCRYCEDLLHQQARRDLYTHRAHRLYIEENIFVGFYLVEIDCSRRLLHPADGNECCLEQTPLDCPSYS